MASAEILGGKYKLSEPIGEGGMGTVHAGWHLRTDRPVAIKLLRKERAENRGVIARFKREAKAAARIDHDNICEVLDFGVDQQGTYYLVMPLLRGRTLNRVIREMGPLEFERACNITSQILSGMTAAHDKGLIHRDLKPENIFLTTVGDRKDFVKILDFGIIKVEASKSGGFDESALTKTDAIVGTPYYMAPEQARGEKTIDSRVDLYATGVILYEMLTGERPFTGATFNEILWSLWNDPIRSPLALRPDLPEALEAVVLKAISRDPDKRYANASAMSEALSQALEAMRSVDGGKPSLHTLQTCLDESQVGIPAQPVDGLEEHPSPKPDHEGRQRQPRRRGASFLSSAGAVLLCAILGLFAFMHLDTDDQSLAQGTSDAAPSALTSSASATLLSTAASTDPHDAGLPIEATSDATDTVRVSLKGLPPEVSVAVDGVPMPGPEFELKRSATKMLIVVRADRHNPWQQWISPEEDQLIPVELVPIPRRRDRRARKRSKRSEGEGETFRRAEGDETPSEKRPVGPIFEFDTAP